MITTDDIISGFEGLRTRFTELYQAITGEVNSNATLSDLTSASKEADYNKWMYVFSGVGVIMDSIWEDRQKQISDKVDSGVPGNDRWIHKELFKFQFGDSLQWDEKNGRYYYPVIDPTKQVIKRCAVTSASGAIIKVASEDSSGNPIPLTSEQLAAFKAFVHQIQWSGAVVLPPISINGDKLKAPMTVYYDATAKLEDIKNIVEPAWLLYIANLPFNGEYSVNKHGDFVESASQLIREVSTGNVQARPDAGSFITVNRVYTPASGYLIKDSATSFDSMITYVPVV
jgi:hypothetical protein